MKAIQHPTVGAADAIRVEEAASQATSSTRLHWLDHLRVALVVLVVVHHIALVYGASSPFYYVEPPTGDPTGFKALLVFVLFNQAWFMGALFLLAGFFTPHSFDRKGGAAFLRDRLVRLGIPLVIYFYVLNPIAGLGVFLMPPELTGITSSPTWATYPDLIGLGPLWFVAMLLIFSVGYVGWVALRGTAVRTVAGFSPGAGSLALFVVLLAGASYVTRMAIPLGESVLEFPTLSYLPQYLTFFVIGAAARRRGWARQLTGGAGWFGAGFATVSAAVLFPLAFSGHMFSLELTGTFENAMGRGHWESAVYALWDSAFAVGVTLAVMVVFQRWVNHRGRVGSFLSTHGYAVYIIHTPIIVIGAYLLRAVDMTAIAKTTLVSLVLVPVCFGTAWVLRSVPGMKRIL